MDTEGILMFKSVTDALLKGGNMTHNHTNIGGGGAMHF